MRLCSSKTLYTKIGSGLDLAPGLQSANPYSRALIYVLKFKFPMELFISYFNIKQPNPFSARTIPLPSHSKLCSLGSTLGRQPLQHPHLFEAILSFRNMLQNLKYCTKRSSPLQNFVYSILVSI